MMVFSLLFLISLVAAAVIHGIYLSRVRAAGGVHSEGTYLWEILRIATAAIVVQRLALARLGQSVPSATWVVFGLVFVAYISLTVYEFSRILLPSYSAAEERQARRREQFLSIMLGHIAQVAMVILMTEIAVPHLHSARA